MSWKSSELMMGHMPVFARFYSHLSFIRLLEVNQMAYFLLNKVSQNGQITAICGDKYRYRSLSLKFFMTTLWSSERFVGTEFCFAFNKGSAREILSSYLLMAEGNSLLLRRIFIFWGGGSVTLFHGFERSARRVFARVLLRWCDFFDFSYSA